MTQGRAENVRILAIGAIDFCAEILYNKSVSVEFKNRVTR